MSLILNGCTTAPKSPEALAYKTIDVAFSAYDMGMTTAAELYKQEIISRNEWEAVKEVGGKFHQAILTAAKLAERWSNALTEGNEGESATLYQKLLQSLELLKDSQQDFATMINKWRT